jgi:hypothetical protein
MATDRYAEISRGRRLFQIAVLLLIQAIALILLALLLPGLQIDSLVAAGAVAAVLVVAQVAYWWIFTTLLSWLPVWLFPVLTFLLSGLVVYVAGNFVPGIVVANLRTGIWVSLTLTAVNAVFGGLAALNMDEYFDRNVTMKMVRRRGQPIETDVPGFLFLEIDGLGEKLFRRALKEGYMPTLKRWQASGSHTILGWETDFTAQTGAMQTGILMGSNDEIPAYRWWDREQGRIVMSGNPVDARQIEQRLSSGLGLLSEGGASRGNMFSGDATESMLTFGTLLDRSRGRGPGFYFYLFSTYVLARLVTRYFVEVVLELRQAWQQRQRKDKYIIKQRNIGYAFFRGVMGPITQDLVTYTVISDVLRGLPAAYALYAGYDDVSHFAGMQTPDAFGMLTEIDHYFARIEKALQHAPRPYHIVVLSDHGQSEGPTFLAAHGLELNDLVQSLLKGEGKVFADLDNNEAWDNINAFLSESVNDDTRTAAILRRALRSRMRDQAVMVGPARNAEEADALENEVDKADVLVMASGCTGLINFKDAQQRLTYEEIQDRHPELIIGLVRHPGIGFVLVRSAEQGDMVIGRGGINFLDAGKIEGADPLAPYGPNAATLMKRESSFANCPDLIVNSVYDPETEELCGFEHQVSHHGGFGGPQNHAFILHPVELPEPEQPVVRAENVYRLLRGWRAQVQGIPPAQEEQATQVIQ